MSINTSVSDTELEPGKHARYTKAETDDSASEPGTAAGMSKGLTVSTSQIEGSVSIRTIPTSASLFTCKEPTT